MANKNNEDIYCSFCGKPQEMAGRLIAGNGVYICDQCVELCMNILRESGELEHENENRLLARGGFYAALYNSQFEDVVA